MSGEYYPRYCGPCGNACCPCRCPRMCPPPQPYYIPPYPFPPYTTGDPIPQDGEWTITWHGSGTGEGVKEQG